MPPSAPTDLLRKSTSFFHLDVGFFGLVDYNEAKVFQKLQLSNTMEPLTIRGRIHKLHKYRVVSEMSLRSDKRVSSSRSTID